MSKESAMGNGMNGTTHTESGVHRIERDQRKRKIKNRLLAALKVAGYIGIAIGSGFGAYVKATGETKGVAEAAAIAKLDERTTQHEKEITAIKTWMETKGDTINRIAYRLGILPLDAPPPPNLGVVPMPAASVSSAPPKPKPVPQ